MKVIITLKTEHADGLGGEILETMGMARSPDSNAVFFRDTHDTFEQSNEEVSRANSEPYVEALRAYGIEPIRVEHHSGTGMATVLIG